MHVGGNRRGYVFHSPDYSPDGAGNALDQPHDHILAPADKLSGQALDVADAALHYRGEAGFQCAAHALDAAAQQLDDAATQFDPVKGGNDIGNRQQNLRNVRHQRGHSLDQALPQHDDQLHTRFQ